MIKTVDIKELKANHPVEYKKEHERYCSWQWECGLDVEFYKECLNEDHKWLDVDKIHYSISYSQGDHAYFTGRIYLEKFLDVFDTENEYFVLREAMKMGDCDEYMVVSRSNYRGGGAAFDSIEWRGYWDGVLEAEEPLKCDGLYKSILEGMKYGEYHNICHELIGDLETWGKGKCEQMFSKLYDDLCNDIDYQMSEEAFDEWAESMDEKFEVEVDDEGDTEEGQTQCGGAVSTDEVGRLAA